MKNIYCIIKLNYWGFQKCTLLVTYPFSWAEIVLFFDHVRIATFFCGKTWVGKGCQLPFIRKFRFNGMIKVLPYCWGWRRMKLQGHTDNWVKCCQRELQIVPCRFLHATNVVVKKLAQWNNSNKEEAMILQKLCYPNIQMFLGLGLAREWCPCHFKIPQHKQKVCHFRKCRWRKLTSEESWWGIWYLVRYLHR